MEVLLKTIPNSDKIIQEYKNDIALCKKAGEKEFDCIKLVDLKYTRKYPALKDLVYPWVNYDWDYTTFVDNNYNNKVTGATDRATLGGLFDNMDAMTTLGKGYIFNANPGSNSQAGTSDLTQCDPTSNDYAGCTILNEIRQSGKGQAPPYPDSFFNKSLSGENSSSYYIKAGTCPKPELNHKECLSKGYQWIGNPLFDATPASLRPSDFIPGSCFKPKYAYIKNTPGLELDFGDIANINKDLGDLASKAAGGLSKLASVGMDSDCVYVMDVLYKVGKKFVKGKIVVDSGAAECVMPYGMLPHLEVLPKKKGIMFTAANGKEMGNYGQKLVEFVQFDGRDETKRHDDKMMVNGLGFTRRA